MNSIRKTMIAERPAPQTSNTLRRKSKARLTVTTRNGIRLRVEELQSDSELELYEMCEARKAELFKEYGEGDVYVFTNT